MKDVNLDMFRKQISEDIEIIQKDYQWNDIKLAKSEYAFNYWILNKLYSVDEELCYDLITDYNDRGVDCYVHFDDTKELFIIQNKYYSESTSLNRPEVSNFLNSPITLLNKEEYKRNFNLQKLFTKAKKDPDYRIIFQLNISNSTVKNNSDINCLINNFKNPYPDDIEAYICAELNDIEELYMRYYQKRYKQPIEFSHSLTIRYNRNQLSILPNDHDMPEMIKTFYIMSNVFEIYKMFKNAVNKSYPIFEENIRDYLGSKGINKAIIKTLKDPNERNKFFYFNNGITIICDVANKHSITAGHSIDMKNPQIVNGCQTVNTIYDVLSNYKEEEAKDTFRDCFVITKVLVVDKTDANKKLYEDIVKYTNSQNAINEKAFAAKTQYFENLQTEFKNRGFLLSIKPSDNYTFSTIDRNEVSNLRKISSVLLQKFGLPCQETKDIIIPLDKLLQVVLAFVKDGYFAYTKKNDVLRRNSSIYKDISLNLDQWLNINNLLFLFAFFKLAETEKKASEDKKTPIPYYMIDLLGKICINKEYNHTDEIFSSLETEDELFKHLYDFLKIQTKQYRDKYYRNFNIEYNQMIKSEIKSDIYSDNIVNAIDYIKYDPLKPLVDKLIKNL